MQRDFYKKIRESQEINFNKLQKFLLNLHPAIIFTLILINIMIPIFTIFYYYWQFEFYHPLFWIFIPDSYTFAILFGIFIIITPLRKRNIQVLNIITLIGLVKVFIGYIVLCFVRPQFFDIISLTAHSFEVVEGLMILPFIRINMRHYIAASTILIIDWFFDFFNPFGLPTLPLYPYHPEFNVYNLAPFINVFFIIYSVIIFGFIMVIGIFNCSSLSRKR